MFTGMKRLAAGAAALSLAVAGLAGCSGDSDKSSDTGSSRSSSTRVEKSDRKDRKAEKKEKEKEEEEVVETGDEEACELFSDTLGLLDEEDEVADPDKYVKKMLAAMDSAADLAETRELAKNMRAVKDGLQALWDAAEESDDYTEEVEQELITMTLALMRVAETCEAEGVPLEGYDDLMEDSGLEDMSVDEVEEMLDLYYDD